MSADAPTTLSANPSEIRPHLQWVGVLPDRGTEFLSAEIPNAVPLDLLRERGIVEQVKTEYRYELVDNPDVDGEFEVDGVRHVYEVTDLAAETFAEREPETVMPCGHTGISNEGAYYTCGFEYCDREFDRDELEVSER